MFDVNCERILERSAYELLNFFYLSFLFLTGTNFFDMKNNKIFTKATLDREKNPSLKVNIQCHIKMGSFVFSDTKVFNISVNDVNDNPVKVQENHKITNVKLDSQNYEKVCFDILMKLIGYPILYTCVWQNFQEIACSNKNFAN